MACVMGQRDEPHRQASPGSRCRRPCACRLHLDAAGSESRLQEPGRDAHRGWRAGVDRGAVGRRERHRVRRAACNDDQSSPSGSRSRTAKTAPTTCCRRDSIRISFPASEAAEALASGESPEQTGGARPALSPARVPQPCPARRDDIGVRADEPRRGREARADRPGRERAGENLLDPHDRARLSRRLPCRAKSSGARSTRPRRS